MRVKNSPFCHCTFHTSRMQEKIATTGDCAFPVSRAQAKKTRQGLNSPSNFRAHEKTTRRGCFFTNLRLRMVAMPLREHV